jgi:hypothetical protein
MTILAVTFLAVVSACVCTWMTALPLFGTRYSTFYVPVLLITSLLDWVFTGTIEVHGGSAIPRDSFRTFLLFGRRMITTWETVVDHFLTVVMVMKLTTLIYTSMYATGIFLLTLFGAGEILFLIAFLLDLMTTGSDEAHNGFTFPSDWFRTLLLSG